MGKGIINKVKLFEGISMDAKHLSEYQTAIPISLLSSNGVPFYAVGHLQGHFFKTTYFTVKSINTKQNSAVLNLLAPYPYHKDGNVILPCIKGLLRTDICIHVDISFFCGISTVPIPITDCLFVSDIIQENYSLPFMVSETDSPKMIWNTDASKFKNTATITLNYMNGIDLQSGLKLFTKEKIITLIASKGKVRAITVRDLLYIEICPPAKLVKGLIEIQLNRKDEKKIPLN